MRARNPLHDDVSQELTIPSCLDIGPTDQIIKEYEVTTMLSHGQLEVVYLKQAVADFLASRTIVVGKLRWIMKTL